MKLLRAKSAIIVACLFVAGSARSELVVNEVLVNEPGGTTSLEWIELYNNSSQAINSPSFYEITIESTDSISLTLDGLGTIEPFGYAVICRKLFSVGGGIGYEEVWGDNSSVWGDGAEETYSIKEVTSISLTNGPGRVLLKRAGTFESELIWPDGGSDGISWERRLPGEATVLQSLATTGNTPGRINSITPLPVDLALDTVEVVADSGRTSIFIEIINRGLTAVTGATVTLYEVNELNPDDFSNVLEIIAVPPTDIGFTTLLGQLFHLSGLYLHLGAVLTDDDRLDNNRKVFMAPGDQFPPVILNEFLANPAVGGAGEWVEIVTQGDISFDMTGWKLGDSQGLDDISNAAITVGNGEYVILAQSSTEFLGHYAGYTGQIVESLQWPTLNNDGDIVRLVDQYGIEASRFEYQSVFSDEATWSRSEEEGSAGRWGRSESPGGSPGEMNSVVFAPAGSSVSIDLDTEIFSPNGDGYQDVLEIRLNASEAEAYSLRIYDRHGRKVKTLIEDEPFLRAVYEWDGRDDQGRKLSLGMYIVYFDVSGVQSVRKTVVVAR
jgi:gliding motility-associated-like protein